MQKNTLITNTKFPEIVFYPYDRNAISILLSNKDWSTLIHEVLHFERNLSSVFKHPLNGRFAVWVKEARQMCNTHKTTSK